MLYGLHGYGLDIGVVTEEECKKRVAAAAQQKWLYLAGGALLGLGASMLLRKK